MQQCALGMQRELPHQQSIAEAGGWVGEQLGADALLRLSHACRAQIFHRVVE